MKSQLKVLAQSGNRSHLTTTFLLILIAIMLFSQRSATAQFINGQNANGVLGQPDFTTRAAATSQNGMWNPRGVAVDASGNLYVADASNNRVLRFNNAASATNGASANAVLGQADFTSNTAPISQSVMNYPQGIAIDPTTGKVFVADISNNRVLRFSSTAAANSGSAAEAVLGQADFTSRSLATTQSGMAGATGVAVDGSGNLYVADYSNNRVLRFNNAATATNGASANGVLGQPDFTSNTSVTTQSGMNYPIGVAVDGSGNLYVADYSNNRVLRFNNAASATNGANANAVLGQADFTSSTSAVTQSGMYRPMGIAVDGSGNLYVTDVYNNRVLQFSNAASATNGASANGVLGQPNFTTSASATSQNGMYYPEGVAADGSGNLYVAEYINNRVLRFNVGTLPIELVSFSAKPASIGVLLSWQTATEKNNAGFNLERSTDNTAFSSIGYVKGNGTTTQSHSYAFTDATASGKVFYRLKQTDYDGTATYSKTVEVKAGTPAAFTLSQNYPNPFNPSTTITYALPQAGQVTLKVYDVLGHEVATLVNENKTAGNYTATFQADKFSSGMYFYKLQSGNFVQTRKMLLVK
jgi:sugar lactone lactonase YvrE